jgi:hypothetical protein
MNNYYVYLHIKNTTGEPFYIGKGKRYRYYDKYGRNKHWHNTVNKYGFDVILLEDCLSEKDAYEKEKYWINRIGRKDLNKGPLVNLNAGGEGGCGYTKTEKQRKEMSLRVLGENNPMFGTKWDKNMKKYFSEKSLGENNGMFNRSLYEVWVKKYGEEIAEEKKLKWLQNLKDKNPFKNKKRLEHSEKMKGKNKGWSNGNSSIYLDVTNGIFYDINEICELTNKKRSTLISQITGKNRNKTNFIKV